MSSLKILIFLLALINMSPIGIMSDDKSDFICGDVNADNDINLLDILYLIDFGYSDPPGEMPKPPEAGDVNSDTYVNLIDILFLIDHLYGIPLGGPPQCPTTVIGENLGSSDYCKDYEKMPDSIYQNQDCIGYNYNEITQTLYITHYNTAFNCCPESLYADIDIINHTITINEQEILDGEGCYCHCLYDMDYAIIGIPAGTYNIVINNMFMGLYPPLVIQTTIDLTSNPFGLYCITRNMPPWGHWK